MKYKLTLEVETNESINTITNYPFIRTVQADGSICIWPKLNDVDIVEAGEICSEQVGDNHENI